MSIGNKKDEGNKGNNFPWQLKNLLGLQKIADNTNGVLSTLTSILNATRAHQDMEILLVRDTGNADLIVQQIREYDETTDTWSTTYTDIAGAPYIPVGPIEYMDASAVLNLILTELLDQGVTLDSMLVNTTSIAAEDFATQTTLNALLTAFNAEDFASQTTLTLIQALLTSIDVGTAAALGQALMVASVPVVIASDQSAVPITLPTGANTLGYIRTVGIAPVVITAGAKKVSIMNIGPDDITVDVGAGAVVLDAGISIPFEAQEGKTLPAITLTGSTALSKHLYTSVI